MLEKLDDDVTHGHRSQPQNYDGDKREKRKEKREGKRKRKEKREKEKGKGKEKAKKRTFSKQWWAIWSPCVVRPHYAYIECKQHKPIIIYFFFQPFSFAS